MLHAGHQTFDAQRRLTGIRKHELLILNQKSLNTWDNFAVCSLIFDPRIQ